VRIDGARPLYLAAGDAFTFTAEVRDGGGNTVSNAVLDWSCTSLSPNFGTITPAGQFMAGHPLAAQVDGTVKVRVALNGIVIGGDGIHVIVHR
ncbi:MAG TPA: hypothetical protein VMF29_00670, partial [Candidatus Edwardsbacteria bacterium]|nr:hypothetical protein [Candidatus Edwardsbacteria bacterium]